MYETYRELFSEWAQIHRREAKLCLEDKLILDDFGQILVKLSEQVIKREAYWHPERAIFSEPQKKALMALIQSKQQNKVHCKKSGGYRL